MPKDRFGEDVEVNPHSGKPRPHCIRCGIVVQYAKELYTICDTCLDEDFIQLCIIARERGITAPLTRKEQRDGQGDRPGADSGPAPGTLSHIRGIVADVTADEVPF